MGQMKRILIDIAETALLERADSETSINFDERNYLDGAWWMEQDADMREQEMARLEEEADIADMRLNGYA